MWLFLLLAVIVGASRWLCAGEKKQFVLPFQLINCHPQGTKCQSIDFPEAHASYLYFEVLAAFELRGQKVEPLKLRVEIGDDDLANQVEWALVTSTDGKPKGEIMRLARWNDFGFAQGLSRVLNRKCSPAFDDKELMKISTQAVIAARAKVSVADLKKGK